MTWSMVDADPIPLALVRLRGSFPLTAALGGADHVGGLWEDPWPHLQVVLGPGTVFGDGRSPADFPVDLAVWGHPDGRDSHKSLRDALVIALESLLDLTDSTPYTAGEPVVTDVTVTSGPEEQTLTNGQRKWVATVVLRLTPPV